MMCLPPPSPVSLFLHREEKRLSLVIPSFRFFSEYWLTSWMRCFGCPLRPLPPPPQHLLMRGGRNRHLTFPQISPADTKIKYRTVYGTTFYEDCLTKGEGSAKVYVKKEKKGVPAEPHEKFKTLSYFSSLFAKADPLPQYFLEGPPLCRKPPSIRFFPLLLSLLHERKFPSAFKVNRRRNKKNQTSEGAKREIY